MNKLILRLGICVAVFGLCLYCYLEKQNQLTHLKIMLPEMEKEIRLIREENQRYRFDIDRFENPAYLIELAHNPEFSHLKHPLLKEILTVHEGIAANEEASQY